MTDVAVTTTEEAMRPDYASSFKLLRTHIGTSRTRMLTSIALATVSVAFELTPIWVVYKLVTAVIAGEADRRMFLTYAVVAAAAVLLHGLSFGAATSRSHRVAFEVIYGLRRAMARRLATLPLGYLAERRSGEAKKLMIDEPESLELVIAHGLPEGSSALANWLAVSAWLFAVDWRMALASVVMTPLAFAAMAVAMAQTRHRIGPFKKASARMNASIVEYLAGMPVMKVFNATGDGFAETGDAVRDYTRIETEFARAYLPFGGSFQALVLAGITVILPIGAWRLATGDIELKTLLFFVIFGANYSRPLMRLFDKFREFSGVSMGATEVLTMMSQAPQRDTGQPVELRSYDVEFEHVSFAYGTRDVLHDISFIARQGEVTALVGPSGSGKSTIASLVPRLWDVREGRVLVGGVDVRDIGIEHLMRDVAFVFQTNFLFSDTIASNIRFGRPSATDQEVRDAARAARAHDFIMALPEGYDTVLGARGASLSGGERQRLAIARAILKDAPIVVLDEATAFTDPDNEAAIQEAIGALTAGKTLIVIAHRLHTIRDAEQIIVVDAGRIAERGRHDELIEHGGLYASLWRDHTEAEQITLRSAPAAAVAP